MLLVAIPGVQVWNADFRNRWRTNAVCAIKIWQSTILLRHRQVSDVHECYIEKVCAQCCFAVFNMSKFIPIKEHSWTALIFGFHLKKTAAESYRLLRKAHGEHVEHILNKALFIIISNLTCFFWKKSAFHTGIVPYLIAPFLLDHNKVLSQNWKFSIFCKIFLNFSPPCVLLFF